MARRKKQNPDMVQVATVALLIALGFIVLIVAFFTTLNLQNHP